MNRSVDNIKTGFKVLLLVLAGSLICYGRLLASDSRQLTRAHTESLFMGEDLSVVTIASGRQESAFQAPAVINVIYPEDLQGYANPDFTTFFSNVPGIYFAPNKERSTPYLRGIPDSVLWLYDSVPMGSAVSRETLTFNYPLFFTGLKQVEVVRGPGSVLWGPDAFAGVGNVVPLSANDFQGIESGVFVTGEGPQSGGYLNYGTLTKDWDTFLNFYAATRKNKGTVNTVSFNTGGGTPAPLELRYGSKDLSPGHAVGFTGKFIFKDNVNLMVHVTDDAHAFAQHNLESTLSWQEKKQATTAMLSAASKIELKPDTLLQIKSSVTNNSFSQEIVDYAFTHEETVFYMESFVEQSLFRGGGSLVAGSSLRLRDINDLPVWSAYLPDYLGPDNLAFLPEVSRVSLNTSLVSLFSRYYHSKGAASLWAGVRYDISDTFDNFTSFSSGLSYELPYQQVIKAVWGTAYRIPVLTGYDSSVDLKPEKIETLSFQYAWNPKPDQLIFATLYTSDVENRRADDLYLGVSQPDDFSLGGMEFEFKMPLAEKFSLAGVMAYNRVKDAEEAFLYNDYIIVNPDGSLSPHYTPVSKSMNTGPDFRGHLVFSWKPEPELYLFAAIEYISSTDFVSIKNTTPTRLDDVWLTDIGLKKENFPADQMDLTMSIENIFDRDWQVAGKYGPEDGAGIGISVMFNKRF